MDTPQKLRESIEKLIPNLQHTQIIEESQRISKIYRENKGKGNRLVTKKTEAIAYAISRMPSTYYAIHSALNNALKNYDDKIENALDVGAGTGAATWAVSDLLSIDKITCLEREKEMIDIGKKLMENHENLSNIEWKEFNLTKNQIEEKYDLVIISYVINELSEEDRKKSIIKLWEATDKILLIIEPGTPEGFKHILEAREMLLKENGSIVAPCTHQNKCLIGEEDWCSFYTRVPRSGIQRQAKKGELSYEDEKFSYIAFSKKPIKHNGTRILRHPQINKGYIKVKVCSDKAIEEKIYSKKDGEIYKKIRKLDAGDMLLFNSL